MEPTQTDRERLATLLATALDSAIGAENGVTKADLAVALYGDDSSESKYKTTQFLARYRRDRLVTDGVMYVAFHRDGEWKNAAIADTDEGFEISNRDGSRAQSAINGLGNRIKFLWSKGLLTQAQIDALEADRRIMGTSLLTPLALPQIATPQQAA